MIDLKNINSIPCKILGPLGKLISHSKSFYRSSHPTHLITFNANLFNENSHKIWYGDLDITLDKDKLQQVSNEINSIIYILHEIDGRFSNEENPLIENFVVKFIPNNSYELGVLTEKYYNGELKLRNF